jgi:hypothetical protein
MIKPLAVCGALAVFVIIIAVAFALSPSNSKLGVTAEQFKLLQPGMTQSETERVLHGPPRNVLGHTAIIWLPQASGRPNTAWIEPVSPAVDLFVREDKPIPKGGRQGLTVRAAQDYFPQITSKSGHQATWVSSTGLIAVYYGPDGKLQHKYISTVDELAPPSLGHWLASRPGMIRRSFGF